MIALDAFETIDDLLDLHAGNEATDALQIAVASTIKLHVAYDTVLHFDIDVGGASAVGLVGCFHLSFEF